MSLSPWADWEGRTEALDDVVSPTPARAMTATLGRDPAGAFPHGAEVSPLWAWLYFLPLAPMSAVGPDGHPKRGGFLPPIELPRRMWAGSRCTFHAPMCIGDAMRKTSTILKIAEKAGNAGKLIFVTVKHDVRIGERVVMIEEQDLVYMSIPAVWQPPVPNPLPQCDWSETIEADAVFLFRFSALTFNGHRIHYDRTYAMDVEKYPGLVVHGPAQAVLLFDAATRRHPERRPAAFSFRGVRPLFDFDKVSLNGKARADDTLDLFTANADGAIGMQASLAWAS